MSEETIEYYRDLREFNRERKAKNLEENLEKLERRGIQYKEFNQGRHIVFTWNFVKVDFYPTTNLVKYGKQKFYGIERLIGRC